MNDLNKLKMQSLILDYMSDSIFVHDLNGKFIYVNKEAYESRGYTQDELLSMHVKDLDAPMDEESILKMKKNISKMKEEGFVTFEIKHRKKDTSIIPVEIRSQIFFLNDEKLVISVARDIGERYIMQEKLKTMATTDSLTGVYNRHMFEILFNKELNKQNRDNTSLSLLLIDIDFFKNVNDNFGHDIGDKILKEITSILIKSIRASDTFARWGGEEFILVLPNTEESAALTIANKLKLLVSSYSFDIVNKITISIGVYSSKENSSLDKFIKKADIALYNAKKLGRNRIEVFKEV